MKIGKICSSQADHACLLMPLQSSNRLIITTRYFILYTFCGVKHQKWINTFYCVRNISSKQNIERCLWMNSRVNVHSGAYQNGQSVYQAIRLTKLGSSCIGCIDTFFLTKQTAFHYFGRKLRIQDGVTTSQNSGPDWELATLASVWAI